jgi:hypothetical protein
VSPRFNFTRAAELRAQREKASRAAAQLLAPTGAAAASKIKSNIPDAEFTSEEDAGLQQSNAYVTVEYEDQSQDPYNYSGWAGSPANLPSTLNASSMSAPSLAATAMSHVPALAPVVAVSANALNNMVDLAALGDAPAAALPPAAGAVPFQQAAQVSPTGGAFQDPSLTNSPLRASSSSASQVTSEGSQSLVGGAHMAADGGNAFGPMPVPGWGEQGDLVGDWMVNVTEPQMAGFMCKAGPARHQPRQYRSLPGSLTQECQQRLLAIVRLILSDAYSNPHSCQREHSTKQACVSA